MLEKYKEARIDYTKAIELLPEQGPEYKYWRGFCNYNLNLPQEALDDFKSFLEKTPKDSYILLMAGHSLYVLKDYQQAVEYYSKAITIKSDYTEAYYWRGYSYFNLGRKTEQRGMLTGRSHWIQATRPIKISNAII
ncbi:MAG: tetratricopeptide repeat protein [Cyclobacteriaceae bacterium]|nr:tetratricopeptide repeat protein [Cyclobacteriaceae bacterium]